MTDQKNLILALVLATFVILGWDYFYVKPQQAALEAQRASEVVASQPAGADAATPQPGASGLPVAPGAVALDRAAAIGQTSRLAIRSPALSGSINLQGARIDDLVLKDYRDSVERDSANVELFSPAGTPNAYFAELGWVAAGAGLTLPTVATLWSADADVLEPGKPVTLSWTSPQAILFEIIVTLDDRFLFQIEQRVTNRSGGPVALNSYGLVSRTGEPEGQRFFILHEGALGVFNERLAEQTYDDIRDDQLIETQTRGGWLGLTDKYWMAALIPDQQASLRTAVKYLPGDRYQTDFLADAATVGDGASMSTTTHLFAGAKEVNLIEGYGSTLGVKLFDRAIDWGWFWFLTKPIFQLLHWLNGMLGNFGIAIIVLTIIVKLIMFPLANKSYASMNRMKEIQPRIKEMQERYKDDREGFQKAMVAIYQKEKINPVGGCLPLILQFPVFFALYKVLMVSIEMRHAPFFGWIRDLSAPDPLTPVNLFGLIPFDPPSFIGIGVLPILMGVTMWLQMRLNPTPPDPIQQKVFAFMPIILTFIMAGFAAGLVLYWTVNNILSIGQQWLLLKRHKPTPVKA